MSPVHPSATQSPPGAVSEEQIATLLSDWVRTVGLQIRSRVHLALAETKLAVTTFVLLIFLVVVSAGAVVMAWGLLLFAAVQALALAGLSLIFALIVASFLHLLAAWGLWRLANRLGRHMEFRASRGLVES